MHIEEVNSVSALFKGIHDEPHSRSQEGIDPQISGHWLLVAIEGSYSLGHTVAKRFAMG